MQIVKLWPVDLESRFPIGTLVFFHAQWSAGSVLALRALRSGIGQEVLARCVVVDLDCVPADFQRHALGGLLHGVGSLFGRGESGWELLGESFRELPSSVDGFLSEYTLEES